MVADFRGRARLHLNVPMNDNHSPSAPVAKIVLPRGAVIDCVVRARSPRGAVVFATDTTGVPDRVTLDLGAEAISAEVVWRQRHEIGLRLHP